MVFYHLRDWNHHIGRIIQMNRNLLLVLTGTSGSGKTTLCSRFLEEINGTERVITTTTRKPRKGEANGIDYHFETKENFLRRVDNGEFLEHASVYNYFYGVSKAALSKCAGQDLIICLDVHGAQTLKASFDMSEMVHRLITIFVCPATLEDLKHRLIMRGTDDELTIQKRLQTAEMELHTLSQFDYHLCSQDKEHDWLCLQHIYFAEKMRI